MEQNWRTKISWYYPFNGEATCGLHRRTPINRSRERFTDGQRHKEETSAVLNEILLGAVGVIL
jgi:hypothetical protein